MALKDKKKNITGTSAGTSAVKGEVSSNSSDVYTYMSQKMLDKIISQSSSYSYDMNADPLYQQYADMYRNESKTAAKDIFGLASSLTGGYGNSYASTAASGIYSQYADKLALKGLELEQKNYDRHTDSIKNMKSVYEAYSSMAESEAEKERDERDFQYKKEKDEKEFLYEKEKDEKEFLYKQERDKLSDEKESLKKLLEFAFKAAENGDYGYLESLGVDVTSLRRNEAYDSAAFKAQYGDYSGLRELGINTDKLINDRLSEQAELFAKFGDYSVLRELGVDISNLKAEEKRELAEMYAKYGDYSLLQSLGVNTSHREEEEYYDRLLTWARYLRALRW